MTAWHRRKGEGTINCWQKPGCRLQWLRGTIGETLHNTGYRKLAMLAFVYNRLAPYSATLDPYTWRKCTALASVCKGLAASASLLW